MCDKCIQICNAITELRSEEGCSVTIFSDNADFIGHNSRVDVERDFGEFKVSYLADSILAALKCAVEDFREAMSQ